MSSTVRLRIESRDNVQGGYRVSLWQEDGNPSVQLAAGILPDSVNDQKFRNKILETADSDPKFKAIGQHLFTHLWGTAIGPEWEEKRQHSASLRTILDIQDGDLALLPWELLYHPHQSRLFFLDHQHPWFRWRPPSDKILACACPYPWPARVLVVIGSDALDPAVKSEQEADAIRDALLTPQRPEEATPLSLPTRAFQVEVLRLPTKRLLKGKYKEFRPHILHFIGHGGATGDPPNPRLRFDLDPAEAWNWKAEEVPNDLADLEWRPRLVILNACRSGAPPGAPVDPARANPRPPASPDTQKLAWSMADAFINSQVPAVLAMQADIPGDQAAIFSAAFYERLAAGDALDVAVARARNDMTDSTNDGQNRRDWALPVLTTCMLPEGLLPLRPKITGPRLVEVENCKFYKETQSFVDRQSERLRFLETFEPIPPQTKLYNLVVVHGKPRSGKTWLVNWCAGTCAAQGHEVRRVEIAGPEGTNWLQVLRQIRDGDPKAAKDTPTPVYKPLPAEAFHEFNWTVNHLLQGRTDPWDNQVCEDLYGTLKITAPNLPALCHEAFRKCLEKAADQKPLFLVLDHFRQGPSILPKEEFAWLRDELIAKIAAGAISSPPSPSFVRIVLVLDDSEYENYQVARLDGQFRDVSLNHLTREEFIELGVQFLRCQVLTQCRRTSPDRTKYWKCRQSAQNELSDFKEIILRMRMSEPVEIGKLARLYAMFTDIKAL
jgi:hypothetical protein